MKPKSSNWSKQTGGSHYTKYAIQPFEFSMLNNLDPMQHTIIKYVMTFRDKNGAQDLDKAMHVLALLKEYEYGGKAEHQGDCV